jgi:hypothetical protein
MNPLGKWGFAPSVLCEKNHCGKIGLLAESDRHAPAVLIEKTDT